MTGKVCWDCKLFVPFVLDTGKKGWYAGANRCYLCKHKYNKSKDNLIDYMPLWARADKAILKHMASLKKEVTRLNRMLKDTNQPGKYVLDHIIPRNGYINGTTEKYITGLHLPINVVIILEGPNVIKGCVFTSEMEAHEIERLLKYDPCNTHLHCIENTTSAK